MYIVKRTQLYLDEEEYGVLEVLARQRRCSVSELVREAIRLTYFRRRSLDPVKVLAETRGLWKDREDLGETEEYLRRLRRGTRLERCDQ